jgi:purine-binding chemotaxis protein CheW
MSQSHLPENENTEKLALTEDQLRQLSFSLGTEEYAIPLLSVKEVIALPETTPVPFSPSYFVGIMNLRGQVISVLDLRLKLGIKAQNTAETVVIICDLQPLSIGVVVNAVNNVLTLKPEELGPKPDIGNSKASEYIAGVCKRDSKLILLLDIAKALDVADLAAIKNAQKHNINGKAA